MKKLLIFLAMLSLAKISGAQNSIGIGTFNPNASAVLDISSSNKGLLIPRLGTSQRTAINSPAKGLMVYDTSSSSFWLYNGIAWDEIQNTSFNSWQKNA